MAFISMYICIAKNIHTLSSLVQSSGPDANIFHSTAKLSPSSFPIPSPQIHSPQRISLSLSLSLSPITHHPLRKSQPQLQSQPQPHSTPLPFTRLDSTRLHSTPLRSPIFFSLMPCPALQCPTLLNEAKEGRKGRRRRENDEANSLPTSLPHPQH